MCATNLSIFETFALVLPLGAFLYVSLLWVSIVAQPAIRTCSKAFHPHEILLDEAEHP
jgi:hypothetical protein